jgi:hypothetical protein
MDRMVDFTEAARKWRHEDDGVEDGSGKQTVAAGGETDRLTETLAGRKFLTIWAAEFHAGDKATLADLMDEWLAGLESGKAGREVGDFFR